MLTSRIGIAAIQLWAAAFIAIFGSYAVTSVVGLRVPVQLLYALPLAVWGLLQLRGRADALDWAVLGAVAAHLVVAVLGVDPLGSLQAGGLALCFALLFWLMRGVSHATRSALSVSVVVPATLWLLAAAVVWIGEKVAWVAAGGGWPALESYQVLVWGSANGFPVLALLATPFVAFMPAGRVRALLAPTLGLAALVVVPLSVGRAGWLGIMTAVVAFEVLRGAPIARLAFGSRMRRATSVAAASMVFLAGAVLVDAADIRGALAANLQSRGLIWEQAASIFGDDPFTGSGPGTYSWVRLTHVPDYADPVGVVLAHNAWLQTLADGGLALAAAFGAVVLVWLVAVWRQRASMSGAQHLAAAAVIGLGTASLLDDFSYLPAIIAMAVTLAAWCVSYEPASQRSGLRGRWLALGAAMLAVVVIIPALQVERARLAANTARAAAVEGRWRDAVNGFGSASALHSTNPPNKLGLGLALAESGEVKGARLAYEAALRLSPGDPRAAGALAAVTESTEARIALLDRATRRSTDAQYAVRLSIEVREVGQLARAAEAYAWAVFLRPDLYALHSDAAGEVSRNDVRHALLSATAGVRTADPNEMSRVLWDIGLVEGELPNDAPPAWKAVAAAVEGDYASAESFVADARVAAPHDQFTHLAAAAVARFACDTDGYDRAMSLAGRVLGSPLPSLAIVRDPIYREPGLGDYQPSWVDRPPAPSVWPFGLVAPTACPS